MSTSIHSCTWGKRVAPSELGLENVTVAHGKLQKKNVPSWATALMGGVPSDDFSPWLASYGP